MNQGLTGGLSNKMFWSEYKIDNKIVDKILQIIKKYNGSNVSENTHTYKGFQTRNIIKLFNFNLLKKIIPVNEMYKNVFHIHYIKYDKGGYQGEHTHPPDDYSFILYLNDADGYTYLKEPVNKKFIPEKGKIIVFDAKILHYAVPSYEKKEVLVGAVKLTK